MNLSEVIRKENEDIKQGGIRNPPHTKVGSLKNKKDFKLVWAERPKPLIHGSKDPFRLLPRQRAACSELKY